MLQIEVTDADGVQRLVQVPDDSVIGKGAENELRLDSWRIGKEHAHLFTTPSGVLLEDMGAYAGVFVNSERVDHQYGPLKPSDVITLGPFKLRVTQMGAATCAPQEREHQMGDALPLTMPVVRATPAKTVAFEVAPAVDAQRQQEDFAWRLRIHTELLATMDLRRHDVSSMSDTQLRAETQTLISQIMLALHAEIPPGLDRALLSKQVLDEAVGLGPLEELLDDDSVTEIMVNRHDQIYVERGGCLHKHPLTFTGERAVLGVIERIVAPLGRRIDESSPMVDARLKDGSRVNAIIAPLALKGPSLTIRKFAKQRLEASDLVRFGALSAEMARFLQICVEARKNIIVSGGTGSGKTTLLNILSNFIPSGERIITVEDAAELKLHHEHLVSLESRPANAEGKGAILIRDLVKNTLRMRPDRIVVGECRGAEALDMLQAMNTGHEGSLTTLHANTPRDGLARLETMVLMAGMDLPLTAIREQISSAVDLVVQQTRFACGSRKVTSITELSGMESGKIQIQEIFKFVSKGYGAAGEPGANKVQGFFTACDMVPGFYEELRAVGTELDMTIFKPAGQARDISPQANSHWRRREGDLKP